MLSDIARLSASPLNLMNMERSQGFHGKEVSPREVIRALGH